MRYAFLLGFLLVSAGVTAPPLLSAREDPPVLPPPPDPPAPEPENKDPPLKIKQLPGTNDAYALALSDLAVHRSFDQPFLRYIWITEGTPEAGKALSYAMNAVSRATTIERPEPLGEEGKLLLVRVDLRVWAPRARDTEEWATLWEDFQFDPAFSLLITKGTLQLLQTSAPNWKGKGVIVRSTDDLEDTEPYTEKDTGKKVRGKWVTHKTLKEEEIDLTKLPDLKDVELIRIPAYGLDPKLYADLSEHTHSQAPVITDTYFERRALDTIKDDGIFADIYGGRYYELSGIPKAGKVGTDEDAIFKFLGIGDVEKGITARQIYASTRSDQRFAMFHSGVTKKPRAGEFLRQLQGHIGTTTGLVSITHDVKRKKFDVDTHPLANLLDFIDASKDDAREGIFDKANGMHGYFLVNGKGERQDVVPQDVAHDGTIPYPDEDDLRPARGCISCHEAGGSDGWMKAENDVLRLVNSRTGLDQWGNLLRSKESASDQIDRLTGLYKADPEEPLIPARNSYAAAVLRATGPWKGGKGDQVDVVKLAATQLIYKEWNRYTYDLITPAIALREEGIELSDPKDDPTKVLKVLLQPDTRAAVAVPEIGQVVVPEDPVIGALKAGISVIRTDYDLRKAFIRERIQHTLATLPRGQNQEQKKEEAGKK